MLYEKLRDIINLIKHQFQNQIGDFNAATGSLGLPKKPAIAFLWLLIALAGFAGLASAPWPQSQELAERIVQQAGASLGWPEQIPTTSGGGRVFVSNTNVLGGVCSADRFIEENTSYAEVGVGGWEPDVPQISRGETLEEVAFAGGKAYLITRINDRGVAIWQILKWKMGDVNFTAMHAISCPEDGGVINVIPYAEALYAAALANGLGVKGDLCANVSCTPAYCANENESHYEGACDPADGQCYYFSQVCEAGCNPTTGLCNDAPADEPAITPTPPVEGDLKIVKLVLLQAIQGGQLAARKPTALRVFLNRPEQGPVHEVLLTLWVDEIEVETISYRLKPLNQITPIEMRTVQDTANFHISGDRLGGYVPHSFRVYARWADENIFDPEPANNQSELRDVSFTETRSLKLVLQPCTSDITPDRIQDFIANMQPYLWSVYPVSEVIVLDILPYDIGLGDLGKVACLLDMPPTRRIYNALADVGYYRNGRADHMIGMFDPTSDRTDEIGGLINPFLPGGLVLSVNHPFVIAHELGHQLYRFEEYEIDPANEGLPLPPNAILYRGHDRWMQNHRYMGYQFVNIMGTGALWPNIDTWNDLLRFYALTSSGNGVGFDGRALAAPAPQEEQEVQGFMVSGSVGSDGSVDIPLVLWLDHQLVEPKLKGETEYGLETLDGNGSRLTYLPLHLDFSLADPFPFSVLIEGGRGEVKRINLLHGQEVLWSRQPSGNAPQIGGIDMQLQSEPLQGKVPVHWQARDPDGQELSFTVLYSPDEGHRWLPLTVGMQGSSYELDTDQLPGCEACRLRVLVHDGWDSGEGELDQPFSVADKPPRIALSAPEEGLSFEQGQSFVLLATTYDLEDGVLEGVRWVSDRDGELGVGHSLVVSLSRGTHTITATVADSINQSASASLNLTIGGGGSSVDPLILIGMVVVLAVGGGILFLGIFLFMRANRRQTAPVRVKQQSMAQRNAAPGTEGVQGERGMKYCIHCGAHLDAGTKFCSQCGGRQ